MPRGAKMRGRSWWQGVAEPRGLYAPITIADAFAQPRGKNYA